MSHLNTGLRATLRNPSDCSVLMHSDNNGHTATLRSAQMLGFASHFVCPQPLYEMTVLK